MNEQFLHYIWKFQYFDKKNLLTEEGEKVEIITAGIHNHDAGADFEDAILKISTTQWQGTIEIDTFGFNWESHHHATNEAYENVILHVIWKNPKEIYRKNGSKVPVLVLENRIDERLWLRYQEFLRNEHKIPCQGYWNEESQENNTENQNIKLIPSFEKMMNRTLDERLIRKSQHVLSLLERNSYDWEETSYQILLEHFGFKKNNAPFLQLAKELPFKIVKKHANQIFQVEALFYGMAGFLEGNGEWELGNGKYNEIQSKGENEKLAQEINEEKTYFESLQKEFRFLSHKYSLQNKEVNLAQWKFLRLRPSNFPTVRLAQVIGLVSQQNHLFSVILNAKTVKEFYHFFENETPEYWKTHYHFGKKNKEGNFNSSLGKDAQQNLIINVVIPIRVAHSLYRQKEDVLSKKWLNELKGEKNNVINLYKPLEKAQKSDFKLKTAAQSQSLLELYSQYCTLKKCLSCEVGKEILKKEV